MIWAGLWVFAEVEDGWGGGARDAHYKILKASQRW